MSIDSAPKVQPEEPPAGERPSLWRRIVADHKRRSDIAYADSTLPRSVINRRKIMWYSALLLIIAVTIGPAINRLVNGLEVTDLTSQMPWGAWVAFYIFFVGLSAGAFILSSLASVFGMVQFERISRAALASAIVSMGVALVFIGFDLGRWDRAVSTLFYFHWTSPLSWEVRFYLIYIALLIAELAIAILIHRRVLRSIPKGHKWAKILGIIGLPLAIFGVHGGTGTIFAVVQARGMWFGGLFPVIFVLSAVVSGTALLTIVYYVQSRAVGRPINKKFVKNLAVVLSAVLAIDLGLTFYEFIIPFLSDHNELATLTVQMSGPYWWTFWIVQLSLGMIIPFAITISALKKKPGAVVFASVLTVIGIVAVRFNIVVPPLIPPVIEGYPMNDYFPTLNEIAVSVCFITAGVLAYSLIAEFLPIHEPDPDEREELVVADAAASPEGND